MHIPQQRLKPLRSESLNRSLVSRSKSATENDSGRIEFKSSRTVLQSVSPHGHNFANSKLNLSKKAENTNDDELSNKGKSFSTNYNEHQQKDKLAKACATLKIDEWQKQVDALITIQNIAENHPELLTPDNLRAFIKDILQCVTSLRSRVSKQGVLTIEAVLQSLSDIPNGAAVLDLIIPVMIPMAISEKQFVATAAWTCLLNICTISRATFQIKALHCVSAFVDHRNSAISAKASSLIAHITDTMIEQQTFTGTIFRTILLPRIAQMLVGRMPLAKRSGRQILQAAYNYFKNGTSSSFHPGIISPDKTNTYLPLHKKEGFHSCVQLFLKESFDLSNATRIALDKAILAISDTPDKFELSSPQSPMTLRTTISSPGYTYPETPCSSSRTINGSTLSSYPAISRTFSQSSKYHQPVVIGSTSLKSPQNSFVTTKKNDTVLSNASSCITNNRTYKRSNDIGIASGTRLHTSLQRSCSPFKEKDGNKKNMNMRQLQEINDRRRAGLSVPTERDRSLSISRVTHKINNRSYSHDKQTELKDQRHIKKNDKQMTIDTHCPTVNLSINKQDNEFMVNQHQINEVNQYIDSANKCHTAHINQSVISSQLFTNNYLDSHTTNSSNFSSIPSTSVNYLDQSKELTSQIRSPTQITVEQQLSECDATHDYKDINPLHIKHTGFNSNHITLHQELKSTPQQRINPQSTVQDDITSMGLSQSISTSNHVVHPSYNHYQHLSLNDDNNNQLMHPSQTNILKSNIKQSFGSNDSVLSSTMTSPIQTDYIHPFHQRPNCYHLPLKENNDRFPINNEYSSFKKSSALINDTQHSLIESYVRPIHSQSSSGYTPVITPAFRSIDHHPSLLPFQQINQHHFLHHEHHYPMSSPLRPGLFGCRPIGNNHMYDSNHSQQTNWIQQKVLQTNSSTNMSPLLSNLNDTHSMKLKMGQESHISSSKVDHMCHSSTLNASIHTDNLQIGKQTDQM